jgi:uncharacterized protein
MQNLQEVIGNYPAFLEEILLRVTAAGFDLADFVQIDHMCYRTVSDENYTHMKDRLASVASLLGETMVNKRPIAAFRLHEPVMYKTWRIDTVEVPAPKAGKDFAEGLEHVEFVLFDDLPAFLKKYAGQPFKMDAADRGINPEIGLQLDDYSVKFHLLSLPAAVYLERKLGMHDIRNGQHDLDRP